MKNPILTHTVQRRLLGNRLYLLIVFVLFLTFAGFASVGRSTISKGEPKNSIPFFEKVRIEKMQSIAVPPFWGDNQHNWHETAGRIFLKEGLTVIPSKEINTALKYTKKDLSSISRDSRIELLAALGRALQADAVLNGLILKKKRGEEVIIQVISSKDARVLWWQAVDFTLPKKLSLSEQRKVLKFVLTPLLSHAGKKRRPAPASLSAYPKEEKASGKSAQEAPDKKKKQTSPDPKAGQKRKSG